MRSAIWTVPKRRLSFWGSSSYNQFEAENGETLVIEFETLEDVKGWRDQPEHREAQERGRI